MTTAALLAKSPLFAKSERKLVDRLAERTSIVKLAPGERALAEGDPARDFYVLLEGIAGVFYTNDAGAHVLVKIFGAPSCFGEMELLFDHVHQELVEAFEPTVLAKIPGALFVEHLKTDVSTTFTLLKDLAGRLAIAAYNERAFAFQELPMRLAGLLLSFADAYSARDARGVVLRTRLSYETLARCLGATTRSVERAMGTWIKQSIVEKHGALYRILDEDKLRALADPDRLPMFSRLDRSPYAPR